MNKQELLDMAQSWGLTKSEQAALNNASSYDAAEARLAVLARRRRLLDWINGVLAVAIGFAGTFLLWQTSSRPPRGGDFVLMFLFVAIIGACAAFVFEGLVSHMLCGIGEHSRLKKVAGTTYCDAALKYIERSTWAGMWRDIAVKERMALRKVDYDVMAALCFEQEKRNEAQRLDAACKKLHAIPDAAEA